MEAPLQQRIVGAIVLVTLGVIFIPALLDGSGYRSRQIQDIDIKEKPEFPPLSRKRLVPIPTPMEQIKSEQAEMRQADPKKRHEKPIRSFALQIGTFTSNESALKMRDEYRKKGFSTFIYKGKVKGESSYKVRIGPELERKVLDKMKKELKKTDKIDAYVVNYP
ncbi:MAG TPA: hypothetical protein ENJ87_03910 [Gammaproteobacteria bacterium]|nr:hypothetical protein [Gammaproteobacteria bacterium]